MTNTDREFQLFAKLTEAIVKLSSAGEAVSFTYHDAFISEEVTKNAEIAHKLVAELFGFEQRLCSEAFSKGFQKGVEAAEALHEQEETHRKAVA